MTEQKSHDHHADSDHIIQVEHISKSYGKNPAIKDLSFYVNRGEIFGFLGPNGAGKTTSLSILEGLMPADSGIVRIFGLDISRYARQIKMCIGVQLQSTSLLQELNIMEQMQLFARLYGITPDTSEIMTLLYLVGLQQKTKSLPDQLSGGQQQRLAIALALVNNPEIIFLDEPTTGLDPQSRHALWNIIRSLREQGKTILLTTHYMDEAESLCDRVGIIDHGCLAALDTPTELISHLVGQSTITVSSDFPINGLENHEEIKIVKQNGDLYHIQTRDMVPSLRMMLDIAEKNHYDINNLMIRQPNLEDVFLNLTGHSIRN